MIAATPRRATMHHETTHESIYGRLWTMALLSFGAMYVLMYAMVDALPNVFNSLNQVYMAGLMTAPMVIIEIIVMRRVYPNKRLNAAVMFASMAVGVVCFTFIRMQTGIGDRQFLRSMIPHHAGAILMCEQAGLTDPEIIELCEGIKAGQQSEIDFMKAKLGVTED
jgi:hypothetical protein